MIVLACLGCRARHMLTPLPGAIMVMASCSWCGALNEWPISPAQSRYFSAESVQHPSLSLAGGLS